MQIVYRTGDFIDGNEPVIIHGCNAQGAMGAGAALAVRNRLPFAYQTYRRVYLARGLRVGEVVWALNVAPGERPRWVGNAITQESYGNDPMIRYLDYDAVYRTIVEVNKFVEWSQSNVSIAGMPPIEVVAMPLIGAGRAHGKWSIISQIVEDEAQAFTPVVYLLDGIIPED